METKQDAEGGLQGNCPVQRTYSFGASDPRQPVILERLLSSRSKGLEAQRGDRKQEVSVDGGTE